MYILCIRTPFFSPTIERCSDSHIMPNVIDCVFLSGWSAAWRANERKYKKKIIKERHVDPGRVAVAVTAEVAPRAPRVRPRAVVRHVYRPLRTYGFPFTLSPVIITLRFPRSSYVYTQYINKYETSNRFWLKDVCGNRRGYICIL